MQLPASVALLFVLWAHAAATAEVETEFETEVLPDDVCSGDEDCSVSLLQRRGEFRVAEMKDEAVADHDEEEEHDAQWSLFGSTTEKCCKCKDKTISWSKSGTCSLCGGKKYIVKTKSVSPDCTVKSGKKFLGSSKCASACRSVVGLLEESEESTEAAVVEQEGEAGEQADEEPEENVLVTADLDQDGEVQHHEAVSYLGGLGNHSHEEHLAMFQTHDADASNGLNGQEFAGALEAWGSGCASHHVSSYCSGSSRHCCTHQSWGWSSTTCHSTSHNSCGGYNSGGYHSSSYHSSGYNQRRRFYGGGYHAGYNNGGSVYHSSGYHSGGGGMYHSSGYHAGYNSYR